MNTLHRPTLRTGTAAPLAALVALLALSGCAAPAAEAQDPAGTASELTTIRLPDSTSYTQLPLVYAEENGFFEEEGLQVEWVQTSDAVVSAGAGDITFAFGPTTSHLRAAANGAPIKIVGAGFRSKGPFWLIAREGIETVEELEGKTVGIGVAGSGLETYAIKILDAHGISADDVTLVESGVQETAYGALSTGQVDATIIHQPFAALGELEGKSVTLARGWEYLPTYQTGDLIAGDVTIANEPEVLEAGLRVYYRAYEYAKANYDDYIPWLQEKLSTIDPEAVRQAIELEDVIWEGNAAIDLEAIEESQRIEIEVGHQDDYYDAEKYIDLSHVPEEYVYDFVYPDPKTADAEAGE
ncbi:ABC transporter substrate-binding protein [Microbacterium hibisci]|uniref:ABC transporter substrate-binding protein n=1 Tax=Microbacterium hibisci TaxID=2036000 RepID=UPI0019407303|nr:ABC transporter substrate-binding protein [Microbacterium hibisci]